jgi:hypothetical protein
VPHETTDVRQRFLDDLPVKEVVNSSVSTVPILIFAEDVVGHSWELLYAVPDVMPKGDQEPQMKGIDLPLQLGYVTVVIEMLLQFEDRIEPKEIVLKRMKEMIACSAPSYLFDSTDHFGPTQNVGRKLHSPKHFLAVGM